MLIEHEKFTELSILSDNSIFKELYSIKTFTDFIKGIEKVGKMYEQYSYEDIVDSDGKVVSSGILKFKGDLFEIFSEIFFKLNSSDNRVGIYDYKPVCEQDDNGVDAYGKSIMGKDEEKKEHIVSTVQIKYRSNPLYELKERDIKQFPYKSIIQYGVNPKVKNCMIIFTNCVGMNRYTDTEVFESMFHVIDGMSIRKLIDNNISFWENSRKLIKDSIEEYIGLDELTNDI